MSRTPGRVRLAVLGLVQLTIDDKDVPLTRLERTLLAGLAVLPDQPVSVDALAEWVWGDQPHASPRNRIQALVSGIRRKTGTRSGVVLTVGPGYRLADTVVCDITECAELRRVASELSDPAERSAVLRQVCDMMTRTPLGGCLDSPLIELKRIQYEEDRRHLLGERIEADLAAGAWPELGAELRALTEEYPHDETFTHQLMRTLALTGRSAEALAVYRRAYQRAVDELGLPPSATLTALHEQILRGEIEPPQPDPAQSPHQMAPAQQASASSYVPLIPRTVPRAVARLVGRDAEVSAVMAAAESADAAPVVVSVTGLSGVGKSTLAIECAHRLHDTFVDGSLYLAMNSETGRAGPSEVLALFLRLLGVSEGHIPEGYDARAAMYRSVIDDRRILVILDDLPDGFDVTDLLPTRPGSMAILTSRRPISNAAPTLHLRLSSLDTENSIALLRGLLGDERVDQAGADAQRLARTCGGVPLLLRVMGQRLASRPDLTLGEAATQLEQEVAGAEPEAAVLAGLEIAEAPLPMPTRTVLRDVAALPFPRYGRWVFETLGGSPAAGDRALDELLAAGFVDPVLRDGDQPQYQLHDLVRLHLRGPTPADRSPLCQVAEHLRDLVAINADVFPAQLVPAPPSEGDRPAGMRTIKRPSPEAALRFFRTEYDTILITARTVCRQRPELAWRLLASTGNYVHTAPDPRGWLVAAQSVRAALSRESRDGRRGRAYLSLIEASLRHEWAESNASIRLARTARGQFVRDGDLAGALVATVVLGRAYRAKGDRVRAEAALRWADQRCGAMVSAVIRGYVALAWGSLDNDYDRLDAAVEHLERAVSWFAGTDDWSGSATAQSALGLVMRRVHRYAEGIPLYDSAIDLFLRLGDQKNYTAMLDGRADLVAQMGDPRRALPDATEAVRRAARAQDPFLLHRAQRTLGRVYTGLGRYDEALAAFQDSAAGFEAMGRPLSLAATLRDIALWYRQRGCRDQARQTLRAERGWLQQAGVVDLSEVDGLLHELDESAGQRRETVR